MAEQKAAPKFSDGDVDERDRRMEAAASAPKTNQGATKPKSGIVTKEELARSGLSLRDYMNKQQGKTRRDGKAPVQAKPSAAPAASASRARVTPAGSVPKQTMGGPYRNEGRNTPAPAAPEKRPGTALPINPSTLRQREEAEKKRDAARAAKRKAEEDEKKARPAKEAAERKALSEQPGAVAYRKKQEERDKMSPGQRSAARGKAIKEFFGMAKGGSVSSASKRADGIAQRGKTRGRMY